MFLEFISKILDNTLMDQVDIRILKIIQEEARIPQASLGRRVGLSTSTVNERLRKLNRQGVINRYAAILDPTRLGFGLGAFIQVLLERPADEKAFLERIRSSPQVLECHHVSGGYSYLLKVRAADTAGLERVLNEVIKPGPGVIRTETLVVLSTAKETTCLPLTGEGQAE